MWYWYILQLTMNVVSWHTRVPIDVRQGSDTAYPLWDVTKHTPKENDKMPLHLVTTVSGPLKWVWFWVGYWWTVWGIWVVDENGWDFGCNISELGVVFKWPTTTGEILGGVIMWPNQMGVILGWTMGGYLSGPLKWVRFCVQHGWIKWGIWVAY
jgi:hypothetical protein